MMKNYKSTAEALKEHREVAVKPSGISMLPMLKENRDTVVIERLERELKVGDVPLYRVEGFQKFVLHRIIKITKDGFIIRGDNVYHTEFVKKEDIIGVLKGYYKGEKYIDCNTSLGYKSYVFFNRLMYPLRKLWVIKIRPFLSKIKRKIMS